MEAKATKTDVIDYLKHDRTLLGGRNLYNKLPNKNLALQRSMSRWTNSDINVERLCYELAMAVGLEPRLLKLYTQNPVKKVAKMEVVNENIEPPAKTPEEKLMEFNPENINYNDARTLAKELEIKPKGRNKEAIFGALVEARKELIQKQVAELPKEVRASIKLRDQFPFLRSPDCPDVLKLLVNDMITSYEDFKKNQPKLHENLTDEDAKELVDIVVQDYVENKMAWAELDHYKNTGQLLGAHPIFEEMKEKEDISNLTTEELVKKIKNLENNITRNKNKGNTELVSKQETLLAHAKAVLSKR